MLLFLTPGAVHEDLKSKIKFCKQSWGYYFETFYDSTKFFFHLK